MTRTRFHQGLDDLKQKLLAMGGMAEQAVERAVRAFQNRDISVCELVLRDEAQINAVEREVDELSIDLLAMQQPMAVDLRFIIACIKINSDLERVGDQAVNQVILPSANLVSSDRSPTGTRTLPGMLRAMGE